MFAWWYASIAVGFLLLAIRRLMVGEQLWPVAMRIVIALAFAVLSYLEFRSRKEAG
jgi:hypothetical protein